MQEKLDTAGVFERLLEVYRAQFTLIVPAALLVFLPVAILTGVFASTGGIGLALVAVVLSILASTWLQGMVIEAVRDMQDGERDFSLGGLFRSVLPVLPILLGVGFLAGLGIVIGLLLLIVPGLILLTLWAVVAPVVVIERAGLGAFGRSRELVRGNGWRVFGVIVVVFILQTIVNNILGAIGGDSFGGQAIASLVSGALVAPVSAIAAALIYLELRKIKEGTQPHAGGVEASPVEQRGEPAATSAFGEGREDTAASAFGERRDEPSPLGGGMSQGDPLGGGDAPPPRQDDSQTFGEGPDTTFRPPSSNP
jgi:hypothetical protein